MELANELKEISLLALKNICLDFCMVLVEDVVMLHDATQRYVTLCQRIPVQCDERKDTIM